MSRNVLKVISLVLTVMISVSLLAGCGGQPAVSDQSTQSGQNTQKESSSAEAATPEQTELEPIDVSMFLMDFAPSPDKFVITKIIKDKFNINMDWQINPYDGFFDKLNVMIASNELPDLIAPIPIDQAKDVGVKGGLVPLNNYFDKMPELSKLLADAKADYASSMASDGNIYAVPAFDEKVNFRYVPAIRQDLLDELGLSAPATYEELYTVLKAIKAKYPDSIGIVNFDKADALNDYGTNFNTRIEMMYDDTQDKFIYGPVNDGYKEMITWFNKMWSEKLLDPEFFTAAQKQWEEKVASGRVAFWLTWPDHSAQYEKTFKDLHPDSKFNMVPIMPMTSNYYGKKVVQGMPQVNTWTTIAISSNSKYIDRLVPFIDWMYSEEGSTALQFGVENETYTVVDGGKKFAENIKAAYNPSATEDPNIYGIGPGGNLLIRIIRKDELQVETEYQKDVNAVLNQYRQNNLYSLFNLGMSLTFTQEQLDERAKYETDLKTYVQEQSIKFITGKIPMSEYDAFKAELEKRGASKIVDIYADAYAKFKENLSKIK